MVIKERQLLSEIKQLPGSYFDKDCPRRNMLYRHLYLSHMKSYAESRSRGDLDFHCKQFLLLAEECYKELNDENQILAKLQNDYDS